MGSIAKYAIFPIQDLFMQDSSCRMNTPGSAFANWAYRYEASALTQDRVDWLKSTTELFGRGRSKKFMIRSLLIVILIVAFLILSIPILIVEWIIESSTLTPVIFLHCVLFSLCLN